MRPPSPLWQVRQKNAHAWAELYFPGYGWQTFEATKSIRAIARPAGAAVRSPAPRVARPPSAPPDRLETGDGEISSRCHLRSQLIPGGHRPGERAPTCRTQGGNLLVIIGLIVLVLAIAAWRWRRSRRLAALPGAGRPAMAPAGPGGGPRRRGATAVGDDLRVRRLAGGADPQAAARDPRPSPTARCGRATRATASPGDAIARMEAAWKRLQWPLVWLAVRRRLRGVLPSR